MQYEKWESWKTVKFRKFYVYLHLKKTRKIQTTLLMKNAFLYATILLSALGLVIVFSSCQNQQAKPEFTLDTPGGVIAESWNDTLPKVIFYYKLDKEGNKTNERIGVAEFYQNQQEYVTGGLKEGKREGKWFAFFPDGSVQTEAFYINGKEHGPYNVYRENGNPIFKGHYNHGSCDGTWYWYDETGKETKKVKTDKNTMGCEWCSRCMGLKRR